MSDILLKIATVLGDSYLKVLLDLIFQFLKLDTTRFYFRIVQGA